MNPIRRLLDRIVRDATLPAHVHGEKVYAVVLSPKTLKPAIPSIIAFASIAFAFGLRVAVYCVLAAALLTLIHPQTLCDISGLRELE